MFFTSMQALQEEQVWEELVPGHFNEKALPVLKHVAAV
jgi:hypothetical protein